MKFMDRKFRLPRKWSNYELSKFAHMFSGCVINVSANYDKDKEGGCYKDYFTEAEDYSISNHELCFQGDSRFNEVYLNLEEAIEKSFVGKFDVVFCHTVLEHIYKVDVAFENLCTISNDIVILVVPFLQQMHSKYGDYWRFTPLTIRNKFLENDYEVIYLSFNSHRNSSVYIFAIGSKFPERWKDRIGNDFTYLDERDAGDGFNNFIGCHAISNIYYKLGLRTFYSNLIRNNFRNFFSRRNIRR